MSKKTVALKPNEIDIVGGGWIGGLIGAAALPAALYAGTSLCPVVALSLARKLSSRGQSFTENDLNSIISTMKEGTSAGVNKCCQVFGLSAIVLSFCS